jgi:hypothetical protein
VTSVDKPTPVNPAVLLSCRNFGGTCAPHFHTAQFQVQGSASCTPEPPTNCSTMLCRQSETQVSHCSDNCAAHNMNTWAAQASQLNSTRTAIAADIAKGAAPGSCPAGTVVGTLASHYTRPSFKYRDRPLHPTTTHIPLCHALKRKSATAASTAQPTTRTPCLEQLLYFIRLPHLAPVLQELWWAHARDNPHGPVPDEGVSPSPRDPRQDGQTTTCFCPDVALVGSTSQPQLNSTQTADTGSASLTTYLKKETHLAPVLQELWRTRARHKSTRPSSR